MENNIENLKSFALCSLGTIVGFSDYASNHLWWVLTLSIIAAAGALVSLIAFIAGFFE